MRGEDGCLHQEEPGLNTRPTQYTRQTIATVSTSSSSGRQPCK